MAAPTHGSSKQQRSTYSNNRSEGKALLCIGHPPDSSVSNGACGTSDFVVPGGYSDRRLGLADVTKSFTISLRGHCMPNGGDVRRLIYINDGGGLHCIFSVISPDARVCPAKSLASVGGRRNRASTAPEQCNQSTHIVQTVHCATLCDTDEQNRATSKRRR